jgi:hypothetical protein
MAHASLGSIAGNSPTERARYRAGRLAAALATAILMLLAGPVAGALAAAPSLNIEEPAPGRGNNPTPTFSGVTDDLIDPVTVDIYEGSSIGAGSPAHTIVSSTAPLGGSWSAGPAETLPDGVYTAQAIQTNLLEETGTSPAVTFTVDTAAPTVTLDAPPSPSNDTTPTFTGTASDTTTVAVQIHAGTSEGPVVATADATGSGGAWTSGEAAPPLLSGQYVAVAVQQSSLAGNPAGVSAPVAFTVDTTSPVVTLDEPTSPSNDTHPAFTGTATGTGTVTIRIYAGPTAQGTLIASATASGTGGAWTSSDASPALASGEYTALASQPSPVGNPAGVSEPVTFTVETAAPTVTLNPPAARSADTTPAFTGTASDTTPVTVEIRAGTSVSGTVVSSAQATVTGGTWTSAQAFPALANGQYTAIAKEASSLDNPTGASAPATFTVDTSAPAVTLDQPITPSNDATPSFTGTASETTPVTVRIYAGASAGGVAVASATASGTGPAWTSTASAPSLLDGQYTAVATQQSSLGNPDGVSEPVTFTVDTAPPAVTMSQPPARSNQTNPTFSGTATDTTPVTVKIHSGTTAAGAIVSSAQATVSGGAWTSARASPALASGQYTAVAEQASSLGNATGKSAAATFTVDTSSPTVTIVAPARSSNTTPTFSGTATESTEVVVHIYDPSNREVSHAKASPHSGSWTSGKASPALSGAAVTYTAVATEVSSLGNSPGSSARVSFEVDTEPPTVTLDSPPLRSNDATPAFTGTASETSQVTVKLYEGVTATGTPIRTTTATPGPSGSWSSAPVSSLPSGKHTYTAVARQASTIGNPEGASNTVTFVVDTEAPTVTLSPPAARTDDATPSFTGTASEATPVTVFIYAGATPAGPVVATAQASGTGAAWSSAAATPALGDGQYTAVASQASAFGSEHVGQSAAATFSVDTVAPHVTLSSPADGAVTGGESQPVSGSADTGEHDLPIVTVQLFAGGASAEGSPLQSVAVRASGGAWTATLGGLTPGTYSVRATQSDDAGNRGLSATHAVTVTASATPGAAQPPTASISWFPTHPVTGQSVSLVANATDALSPITSLAWDLAGGGAFAPGAPTIVASFASPGAHLVRLRVGAANGMTSTVGATIPVGAAALPLMQPFPTVRISSTGSRSSVRLALLAVRAPAGARITVRCTGRSCPMGSQSRVVSARVVARSVEFHRFERRLRAGSEIEIFVSRRGAIGKYTRFVVRRGKLPVRLDKCLNGTYPKPIECPRS